MQHQELGKLLLGAGHHRITTTHHFDKQAQSWRPETEDQGNSQ